MELREESRLDPHARLVAVPEIVAKGLDHVIGRDTDVSGSLLDHLQHGVQHANGRAEFRILALVEAAQTVEVAEQLVGSVYDVHDHLSREEGIHISSESIQTPWWSPSATFVPSE